MVVDTSALMAILLAEPEAEAVLAALQASQVKLISTATLVEAKIVVARALGEPGLQHLDLFLQKAEIDPVPLHLEHVHWALRGWRQFGKGRHRAALNLGDCFSYALAMATSEPLLFKGDDFGLTDVAIALQAP
jgi:ribonuclease VapC